MAAVKNYGIAIQYIANPSEELQLAAVTQDGDAIKHIVKKDRSEYKAVTQDERVIEYIDNPSEEVQLVP